jgi:hypothetical protein
MSDKKFLVRHNSPVYKGVQFRPPRPARRIVKGDS